MKEDKSEKELLMKNYKKFPHSFRLMTFNIRSELIKDKGLLTWENRKGLLTKIILNHDPDIIGIQEATQRQCKELEDLLSEKKYSIVVHACSSTDVNLNSSTNSISVCRSQGECLALFYKSEFFELVKSSNFWLSETPNEKNTKSWDSISPRICQWGLFKPRMSAQHQPHDENIQIQQPLHPRLVENEKSQDIATENVPATSQDSTNANDKSSIEQQQQQQQGSIVIPPSVIISPAENTDGNSVEHQPTSTVEINKETETLLAVTPTTINIVAPSSVTTESSSTAITKSVGDENSGLSQVKLALATNQKPPQTPIIDEEDFDALMQENESATTKAGTASSTMVSALRDRLFFVANTHWDQGREARRNGAFMLREEISNLAGTMTPHVIVMGDFNCDKGSNCLTILRTGIDKIYSKVMPRGDDEEGYSEDEQILFELMFAEDKCAEKTPSALDSFNVQDTVMVGSDDASENQKQTQLTNGGKMSKSKLPALVDFVFVSKTVLVKQSVVCEDPLVSSHLPVLADIMII